MRRRRSSSIRPGRLHPALARRPRLDRLSERRPDRPRDRPPQPGPDAAGAASGTGSPTARAWSASASIMASAAPGSITGPRAGAGSAPDRHPPRPRATAASSMRSASPPRRPRHHRHQRRSPARFARLRVRFRHRHARRARSSSIPRSTSTRVVVGPDGQASTASPMRTTGRASTGSIPSLARIQRALDRDVPGKANRIIDRSDDGNKVADLVDRRRRSRHLLSLRRGPRAACTASPTPMAGLRDMRFAPVRTVSYRSRDGLDHPRRSDPAARAAASAACR